MSLDLHPKCKSQLETVLTETLRHVKVNNDIFLDVESLLPLFENKILPQTGSLYKHLQEYIGDNPLFVFAYEVLSKELGKNGTYNSESSGKFLSDLPNFSNIDALSARIVRELESLPWSYRVSFELTTNVGVRLRKAPMPYSFSSSMRVIAPDQTYDSLYPLQSEIKKRDRRSYAEDLARIHLGFLAVPMQWNHETAYIQIDVKGFIRSHVKTATMDYVLGTLKSFVGLSLATRLMKINQNQIAQPFGTLPKNHLIVHRQIGDKWELSSLYDLPADISTTLNALEIDDLDGKIQPENEIDIIKQHRLPKIATAFDHPDKAESLLHAAQWLLDSYVGSNELLSFVQTTVAMEIMLGEESKSDVLGIGELLRNRCAYLIGKSHSQRKEILKDFNEIYAIRSRIVHRGKNQLSFEERMLFQKLRWMCRRVISEELELIEQDRKK